MRGGSAGSHPGSASWPATLKAASAWTTDARGPLSGVQYAVGGETMRQIIVVLALVGLTSAAAFGQTPSAFVDVPPWHWAFDAVQQGAAAGIFTGYPTSDQELVANALLQVYDAFAHAGHPSARGWAEWVLINTPP